MTPEMSEILKNGFSSFKARTGFNNNDIAEKLGCSPSSVSLYCSGKTSITYETASGLLQMGMKMSELFGQEIADKVGEQKLIEKDDPAKIVMEGLKKILGCVKISDN